MFMEPLNFGGKRVPVLKDRTKEFSLMLQNVSKHPKPRILAIGMTGSGKTAQKFNFIELLIKLNAVKNLRCVWWKAPPDWLEKLDKYLPSYHKGMHVSAKDILEVDEYRKGHNIFLLMDEADREMGANSALEKGAVRFGKAMSLMRQKEIIFHGGSQIGKVTKTMRQQVDIVIYLGNTPTFIQESDNEFAKKQENKIVNLMSPANKKYCYFTSSYSYLCQHPDTGEGKLITRGKLTFDLKELCPYWFEESDKFDDEGNPIKKGDILSKGYENVSLDSDFDEWLTEDELASQIADMFKTEHPNIDKVSTSEIRGWLQEEHKPLAYKVEQYVSDIVDKLKYKLMLKKANNLNTNGTSKSPENNNLQKIDIKFVPGQDFPEFVRENLKKIDPVIAEICFQSLSGTGYREITPIGNISYNAITTTLSDFYSGSVDKKDWTIRAGYLFEKWFGSRLGPSAKIADPSSNDPDIIFENKAYNCKVYNESNASLALRQSKRFKPELEFAQKNNNHYYAIGFFPKWLKKTGCGLRIVEVDPLGPDYVKFERDDKSQYILNEKPKEEEK